MRSIMLAGAALVALLSPAAAQQAGETTNWPTTCQALNREQPLTCVASTIAYLRETGQKMAEVRITTTPSATSRLEIIGPFGTSTDKPFRLKADGSEIATGMIRTCEQDGCHVFIDITEAMSTALLEAKAMSVVFSTPERGEVEVPLPISGLAQAYRSITP